MKRNGWLNDSGRKSREIGEQGDAEQQAASGYDGPEAYLSHVSRKAQALPDPRQGAGLGEAVWDR
jgi:hypothetical protein